MNNFQSQHHVSETGYTRLMQQQPELSKDFTSYPPEVMTGRANPSNVGNIAVQETVANPTQHSETENSYGSAQTSS